MAEDEFSTAFSPAFDFEDSVVSVPGGPCDWPVKYAQCDLGDAMQAISASDKLLAETMAAEMLWNLTNRKFGTCEASIRPCLRNCVGGQQWLNTYYGRGPYPWLGSAGGTAWMPVIIGGAWYNITCGCAETCRCSYTGPTVLLLPGPVASVTRVEIDGVILDPSAYEVRGRVLIRQDGEVWPSCQDLLAPAGDPNTFEVVYARGLPVPVSGQVTTGILALEFAKSMCNDDTCQLPQRVSTITRQGVTVGLLDGFESLDEGRIGIWSVDAWVASVTRSRPYSSVRSVDVPVSAHRG